MQRFWIRLLGGVFAAMCLAGCSRKEGTMSEILIALIAFYLVLKNNLR
jgi:hypothetical protein